MFAAWCFWNLGCIANKGSENHLESDLKTVSSEKIKRNPSKVSVVGFILSNFGELHLKVVVGGKSVEYFLELRNFDEFGMG